ncbi:hypothetical protein AAMO2058_000336200 [Amorphochlora amoebiformis]
MQRSRASIVSYKPEDEVQIIIVKGKLKGSWVNAIIKDAEEGDRYTVYVKDTDLGRRAGCADRRIKHVPVNCLRPNISMMTPVDEDDKHSDQATQRNSSPLVPTPKSLRNGFSGRNLGTFGRTTTPRSDGVSQSDTIASPVQKESSELLYLRKRVQNQDQLILYLRKDMAKLQETVQYMKNQVHELKLQKEILLSKEFGGATASEHQSHRRINSTAVEWVTPPSNATETSLQEAFIKIKQLKDTNKRLSDLLVKEKARKAAAPVHRLYQEALRLYRGKDIQRDPKSAFQLALQAANRGHSRSQCLVGLCYQNGEGIERDEAKAYAFFLLSAIQGYALAQYNLAWCFRDGEGVTRDKSEAFHWFMKAARQGKAGAQYSLGYCYRTGEGIQKNLERACYWFAKAGEQGHVLAQNSMGICYEYGEGTTQDDTKALHWYKKAAESGDSQAQYNLGLCYHYGRGAERDREKALLWFSMSAKQNNKDAVEAMRKLSTLTKLEEKYRPNHRSSDSGSTDKRSSTGTKLHRGWSNMKEMASFESFTPSKASQSTSEISNPRNSLSDSSEKTAHLRPWVKRLASRMSRELTEEESKNPHELLGKLLKARESGAIREGKGPETIVEEEDEEGSQDDHSHISSTPAKLRRVSGTVIRKFGSSSSINRGNSGSSIARTNSGSTLICMNSSSRRPRSPRSHASSDQD